MGSTLVGNGNVAADDASAFDFSELNAGVIERIITAIVDNEIPKSQFSRLADIFKVNIENLDDSTIRERIISTLLDYHNGKYGALPSPSAADSVNNVKKGDDSTLDKKVIRRNVNLSSGAEMKTNSVNNVEKGDDSTLDEKVISRILYLSSNEEMLRRHRSDITDFAKTLGINMENLDNSALAETVINRLLELKNKTHKATTSDNDWWENSNYFDRQDPRSDESATKIEEPLKFGDCYIFNYQKFEDGLEVRPGSESDVARLRHDFHALNFNVYSDFLDLTKEQTLATLKEAAKRNHTKIKCLICCFLTHGEGGKLLTSDGYLKVDEILECFSRSACESLAGKPKIFIFEACGDNLCGVESSHKEIPDYEDFLLLYSTYEGKPSNDEEQENRGSFFINELCRTLEQFSIDTDLLQILTILNFRVAQFRLSYTEEEEILKIKHLPGFTSRLTTELKFNKKIPAYRSDDTKFFDTRRRRFCRLGVKSTKKPLEDKKFYTIRHSRNIKFLLMLNTKNHNGLYDSPSSLLPSVSKRGYRSATLSKWSIEELKNFCKEVRARGLSKTDCLVCFTVCLAEGQRLYDFYGDKFLKKDLVEQFTGKECPELRGKPKIFIFLTASPTKETWTSCFFADITDNDEESTIPVHSDLLDITVTITESKQIKDVVRKFSDIFGKESPEDFLSQLTKMNKEFTKDYVVLPASKKSLHLKAATEKSSIIPKLPPTVDSKPKKTKNLVARMVQFFSPSNSDVTSSQIPPQNSVSRQNSAKEESKVEQKRATFCFNSTLTATLILNNITVPKLTKKESKLD